VSAGVPLDLRLVISSVSNAGACQPLANAQVDIWHCDATGIYSDVRDRNRDTTGQKFLRGHQTTDAGGGTRFTTIYPGWYGGRAVHIHFKVRTPGANGRIDEFTSQLYFADELTDRVHALVPYSARAGRSWCCRSWKRPAATPLRSGSPCGPASRLRRERSAAGGGDDGAAQ
jgi:protocatechuate 3,4-dioxygenase beta subunit